MTVLNIQLGSTGLAGVIPRIVYIDTNDTIATVTATGFLNRYVQEGYNFSESDMCCVTTKLTPFAKAVDVGWFGVNYVAPNWSLVPTNSAPSVTLPTVSNKIAYFTNTSGNLASSIFSTPTIDGSIGDSITTSGAGVQRVATVPGRNRLYNGEFLVWQRSTSFNISNTTIYGPDRWQIAVGAATNVTFSQLHEASYPNGRYVIRIQRNAGDAGTAVFAIAQSIPIDNCIGAAGNYLTLSFKAAKGGNFSPTQLVVSVNTGTGSTDVSNLTTGFVGNTSVLSANIPAASLPTNPAISNFSYTIGPVGATVSQLYVSFSLAGIGVAGTNDFVQLTDIQLEVSPNQTPFERIGFANTLQACKRFYQKTFDYATVPASAAGVATGEFVWIATVAAANTNHSSSILLPVEMLKVPAVTFYNPSNIGAGNQAFDEVFGGVCTNTQLDGVANAKSFKVSCTANAGTIVGNQLAVHYTAEAELT